MIRNQLFHHILVFTLDARKSSHLHLFPGRVDVTSSFFPKQHLRINTIIFFFTRTSLHVKPDHFSSSPFPLDLRIPLFRLGSRQERFGNPCMWLESQSMIWAFRQTVQPGEHHRLPSWKSRVLATSELRKTFKGTKISGNPTGSGKERLCLLFRWD